MSNSENLTYRSSIEKRRQEVDDLIASALFKLGQPGLHQLAAQRELWALREFSRGYIERAFERLAARQAAGKLDDLDRLLIVATIAEHIGVLPRSIQTKLSTGMADIDQEFVASNEAISCHATLTLEQQASRRQELIDRFVERRQQLKESLRLDCDANAMTRLKELLGYLLRDYSFGCRIHNPFDPSSHEYVNQGKLSWFYEQVDAITVALESLRAQCGFEPVDRENLKQTHVPTRSGGTGRGAASAKLVAALSNHHQYQDHSVLNWEPIISSRLAMVADTSKGAASGFFKRHFQGHEKYRHYCIARHTLLIKILANLNGEPLLAAFGHGTDTCEQAQANQLAKRSGRKSLKHRDDE